MKTALAVQSLCENTVIPLNENGEKTEFGKDQPEFGIEKKLFSQGSSVGSLWLRAMSRSLRARAERSHSKRCAHLKC